MNIFSQFECPFSPVDIPQCKYYYAYNSPETKSSICGNISHGGNLCCGWWAQKCVEDAFKTFIESCLKKQINKRIPVPDCTGFDEYDIPRL
jgi:hypothetical protein